MGNDGEGEEMTEYEKQRVSRIRENKARLEALGLPGLASSLGGGLSKQAQGESPSLARNKRKKEEADDEEEYQPSNEEEEEPVESSHSTEEEMLSPPNSTRKGCRSCSSNGSKLSNPGGKDGAFFDNDMALQLESVENENGGAQIQNKAGQIRKSNSTGKEESSHNKITKKPNKSRIQLSEDEVITFFLSFDDVGKGYITAHDIQKMAIAHDFTWTDGEILKMVRSFDSDGDRKLDLEDFQSIVSRCGMLQEPE